MIFISYSHKDETLKDNVVKHLGVLAQDGQLALWDDRRITGGDGWLHEIELSIQSCTIALLLISADFLTSNFILGKEVPPLLQRRAKDGVRVIPVILRPCAWDDVSWLSPIQARPRDGKPLTSMSENDAEEALAALAKEVNRLMKSSSPAPTASPIEIIPTPAPPVRPTYHPSKSVFHVPFAQKGRQVIGRDGTLEAVRQQMVEGRRTAIGHTASFKGLGGLGKTQLAVEYAHQYRDSYPDGVIWINADQEIDAQLTELAVSALWIAPESEHKDKLDVAKQRLRSHGDCLIIFDNLEEQQVVRPYLPNPNSTAHILVTSRIDQPGFTPIPIDPLDTECSLELLCQESCRLPDDPAEEAAAREIGILLGGLPLAIELAGAYLCHRQTFSYANYLARLQDDPLKALPEKFLRSFTGHDPDLFRTLKINEELFEEEPLLTPILDLLTWSGPAVMGIDLMACLLDKTPSELRGALSFGVELRIIQKSPGADRYAIHRLVREVRKVEIPLSERKMWAENIANNVGDWFQELREDFMKLPRFEAEIDHLVAWGNNCLELPSINARLTWLQAFPPYHRGDFRQAHDIVKLSVLVIGENPEQSELTANILADYGATFTFIGDFNNALRFGQQALEIRKAIFDHNNPDTASSYDQIAQIYDNFGNSTKALEYRKVALAIRHTLYGDNHPTVAISYGNIGHTYSKLGDLDKALEFSQKALDIHREVFGDEHPRTATSYNNVGVTYDSHGDHTKALELGKKALDIKIALFADSHPNTATSYNNVGTTYGYLQDHKAALRYKKEALQIRFVLLGEIHPNTASSYYNIGITYNQLHDYKKCLEYWEKALHIRKAIFSENHPDLMKSFYGIGLMHNQLGNPQLAINALNKALHIAQRTLPAKHQLLANIRKSLQGVQSQTKGFRKKRR